MKNKWNSIEEKKYIKKYKNNHISKDLALRIYTTHLLGREKTLVLHGGGNTSLKTTSKNIFNKKIDIMHIKGSGWDMGSIEYPGLPAVELNPLRATLNLKKLNDFDMVNLQRKCLLNSSSPNPSVETLLHAFLPHTYVDHTHASAILSLIDQPNNIKICQDAFGDNVGIVPYVIPGFELAKIAYKVYTQNPKVIGLILLKHGIFTFGNSAKESYDRMIKLVSIAEKKLQKIPNKIITRRALKKNLTIEKKSNLFLPLIRKYLFHKEEDGSYTKWILNIRTNKNIIKYLNHPKLEKFTQRGPITPDHVIRIKPKPLIIDLRKKTGKQIEITIKNNIQKFKSEYKKYFLRNKKYLPNSKESDPNPRLVFIPGFAIIGIGRTLKEASIASDLAECTVDVISKAESFGKFQSINEKEVFKVEYWPLEQDKLKGTIRQPFTGNIVVISGGCGAIGLATAREFLNEGAEVILLENNLLNIKNTPQEIAKNAKIIRCDVTNILDVQKSFEQICLTYGGMDILVSNAGAAWQGNIGTVSDEIIKESFDLNFYAHQYLSQESIKILLTQKTEGVLLYNISKQSVNPGNNFGPYGIPKASTLFLMRQYTLEYGKYGIRANGVNADRIRSGIVTDKMITSRAMSRGVSKKKYMSDNLLEKEVLAEDVAKGFVALAKAKKTTGDVLTIDGGNIAAALR
ncbi:MAG TPA: bifunctional aldolase/short-chain dehydrogenase [Pelagibacterales bacterium]|nr:bifunctional aldolase/short-chain dehydrogenase [Pelagibacterales bacterium]